MKYVEMKKILTRLNKKWKLDFVSATSGDCCSSCGDMRTPKATEQWEKAKTFLMVKWYFKGMNYEGRFEDMEELYVSYELGNLDIREVCNDLREELKGNYEVIEPKNSIECIELVRI